MRKETEYAQSYILRGTVAIPLDPTRCFPCGAVVVVPQESRKIIFIIVDK